MKSFAGLLALAGLAACDYAPSLSEIAEDGAAIMQPSEPARPSAPVAATSPKTNCSAQETPIFSCRVSGGNRLAVCANAQGAQYRFGSEDTPQIVIDGGSWASTAYSGGGEAQIAFSNGDTSYIVFSRMVRTNFRPGEPNDPAISDGVIVQRGDRVLSVRTCEDPETLPVQYDAAEAHIPRTDALFTDHTNRADPS